MSFPGDKWMHEYWTGCVGVLKPRAEAAETDAAQWKANAEKSERHALEWERRAQLAERGAKAARAEVTRLRAALDEAIGRAPGDGEVAPGEAAQIIINARRGPLGDRWISEEPWPSLIADERVAAVRPSWAGSQWEIEMHETGEKSDGQVVSGGDSRPV